MWIRWEKLLLRSSNHILRGLHLTIISCLICLGHFLSRTLHNATATTEFIIMMLYHFYLHMLLYVGMLCWMLWMLTLWVHYMGKSYVTWYLKNTCWLGQIYELISVHDRCLFSSALFSSQNSKTANRARESVKAALKKELDTGFFW